jgi:hypothetical protein
MRMRLAGRVACMGSKRKAYRILVKKLKGQTICRRRRNAEMDNEDMLCKAMDGG